MNSDYVPLVNLISVFFQIRDDYMNLQSTEVSKVPTPSIQLPLDNVPHLYVLYDRPFTMRFTEPSLLLLATALPVLDLSLSPDPESFFRAELTFSTPIIKDSQKILPRGNSVSQSFMGYGLIPRIGSCYVSPPPSLFKSYIHIYLTGYRNHFSFGPIPHHPYVYHSSSVPLSLSLDLHPLPTLLRASWELANPQMCCKNERPITPLKRIQ
jgi:hypothetical protein